MNRLLKIQKNFIQSFAYWQNKNALKIKKMENSFKPLHCKLKEFKVNLKQLVPNFFSQQFNLYECQKKIVQNKRLNHIENSYIKWEIPLSKSKQLQNSLVRLKENQVRIGRILQVMDSVAGLVGYRHCYSSVSQVNPCVIVTGSVDSLHLFQIINSQQDIIVEGYINFVGRTSMEIQINLTQGNSLKAMSFFTMISRDSNDLKKGYEVPSLDFSTLPTQQLLKAKKRYELALINTKNRKIQMSQSYDVAPPSKIDIELIHNLFLNRKVKYSTNSIPIDSTKISNYLLMHVQERNIHGKIFGGYLMREMIQLGWFAGMKFSKGEAFHIEDITNVYFKQAVEIGSGLKIVGQVTFVDKNIIVVTVEAYSLQITDNQQKMSCFLHLLLRTKSQQMNVHPQSYEEALQHLSSRKAYQRIFL